MKKITILLILLLVAILFFGQKPDYSWWAGPRLGINFTTTSGNWSNDYDNKNKFIVTPIIGGIVGYRFTEMIALSAELNLAKTGAVYVENWEDRNGDVVEGRYRERFTTINIPIHARFTFGSDWEYFAYAGIYWSKILCGKYVDKIEAYDYEQSGKIKFGEEPDGYEGDDWYLAKDEHRRMDVGSNIGGGVQKQLGPGVLALDLRFGFGFCDFYKWENKDDKPDGYKGYRNRSIALSLNYNFDF